jgi:hypothetical protein
MPVRVDEPDPARDLGGHERFSAWNAINLSFTKPIV